MSRIKRLFNQCALHWVDSIQIKRQFFSNEKSVWEKNERYRFRVNRQGGSDCLAGRDWCAFQLCLAVICPLAPQKVAFPMSTPAHDNYGSLFQLSSLCRVLTACSPRQVARCHIDLVEVNIDTSRIAHAISFLPWSFQCGAAGMSRYLSPLPPGFKGVHVYFRNPSESCSELHFLVATKGKVKHLPASLYRQAVVLIEGWGSLIRTPDKSKCTA